VLAALRGRQSSSGVTTTDSTERVAGPW
jgi:hypothetical protein